ncbi:hypothetical protein BGW80DRAFT_155496 [Lactifluus volemus]|nr:hypothetical protein BGW80DRAFT_155496 [Lactifluus volemus]
MGHVHSFPNSDGIFTTTTTAGVPLGFLIADRVLIFSTRTILILYLRSHQETCTKVFWAFQSKPKRAKSSDLGLPQKLLSAVFSKSKKSEKVFAPFTDAACTPILWAVTIGCGRGRVGCSESLSARSGAMRTPRIFFGDWVVAILTCPRRP